MAKHLARIHGTEEDKVNCPFYFKIGACRHSDRCSRLHHKPAFSPTLLVKHLYRNPVRQSEVASNPYNNNNNHHGGGGGGHHNASPFGNNSGPVMDDKQALEDFLCFYEDVYMEYSKFGPIEGMHVVDNVGDHLIGHVYIKFRDEEMASDALQVMQGRYYDGRMVDMEFSPVTDFGEARCRDFDEDNCARGGYCNFLHVKPIPPCLVQSLEEDAHHDRVTEEEERHRREKDERKKRRKESDHRHGDHKRHRESSPTDGSYH